MESGHQTDLSRQGVAVTVTVGRIVIVEVTGGTVWCKTIDCVTVSVSVAVLK